VIPNFMIQAAIRWHRYDPGYRFKDEFQNGSASTSRASCDANAAPTPTLAVFITRCHAHLNNKHTIFGECEGVRAGAEDRRAGTASDAAALGDRPQREGAVGAKPAPRDPIGGLRGPSSAAERRQEHAANRCSAEAGHRLAQAADHALAHPRRVTCPGAQIALLDTPGLPLRARRLNARCAAGAADLAEATWRFLIEAAGPGSTPPPARRSSR